LGKVSLDASAGWAAFSDGDGDWVFAQRFVYHPDQEYPDNGASVEIWSQGPGVAAGVDFSRPDWLMYFLELEILGPLVTLRPGEPPHLDRAVSIPPAAAAVELRLADAAGRELGRLDRCTLEGR